LLEGLRAEFGRQQWQETAEEALAELTSPDYAPAPLGEVRDDSLGSLAQMGFTVREVS